MRDPDGLYDLSTMVDLVPEGLPLVAGLTGFADAGSAVSRVSDFLLERLESSEVAVFDADALLDYRARRPTMYFDQDHLSEYRPATLSLRLMKDDLGQPFLLLTGFEPDFQWERFTAAVLQLVARYRVRSTTWVHAIPMPTPHTRPIGVTVSGNRAELIESMSVWKPQTQVPSNALHLVEYRLQEIGHPIAGFVLLIPHYLADTEYPMAAVAALESITAATGLIFPTESLREENREFLAKVDDQVQSNQELQRLVGTLEERHDTYMEDNPLPSPLADVDGELPSADAIAAELERFLANRPRDEDR
ncbi:proteasome assembly chaperone family protein [Homoserinibacter sp. YIM 151385]|uniref:proteasome assembly chaperone family protein n=1 Tax=Homoserinibacter sp. YIM 151385 TaxID=2985506 RepID=UPI0022F0D931|nr:PAC2 family protein [Homoserinibacter sp. YIM 151385]WBU38488.1 PAC2 family protein [Homoserinibacter sp. YIM 151385]